MEGTVGVDEAMPGEGGCCFGECGDTTGRFPTVRAGFECGDDIGVEGGEDGGGAAAGLFFAGADFGADEMEEFGQSERGYENCDDPRVHVGEPVCGDAACAEGPEEREALPLAGVHGEVQSL